MVVVVVVIEVVVVVYLKSLTKISKTKQKRNTSNSNLIYPKPLNMSKRTEAWTQRRIDLFCIYDKYMNVKI